jgi:BolA protein
MKPNIIELKITKVLKDYFNSTSLQLINESHKHNVPEGSESHFKLILVSDTFENMTLVKRHQAVYKALGEVMNEIHALSMHLYDLKEFKANPEIIDSPDCVN